MKETKPNILFAALKLFNENGFVNVRLQHIADEANVSIGNLAYHFPTKKDILAKVYEELVQRQVELLNDLNIVPLFENLDRHWTTVFEIQSEYAFFYQDTLEITRFDESIREKYRAHIHWEKEQYIRLLQFNISRGALQPIDEAGLARTAEHIWLAENSWLHYASISGQEEFKVGAFKDLMWQIFSPHFSHIGKQEYDQLIKNKLIPLT